jgi:hypothetical protein
MYILLILSEFEAIISSSKNHETIAISKTKAPIASVMIIDTLSETLIKVEK